MLCRMLAGASAETLPHHAAVPREAAVPMLDVYDSALQIARLLWEPQRQKRKTPAPLRDAGVLFCRLYAYIIRTSAFESALPAAATVPAQHAAAVTWWSVWVPVMVKIVVTRMSFLPLGSVLYLLLVLDTVNHICEHYWFLFHRGSGAGASRLLRHCALASSGRPHPRSFQLSHLVDWRLPPNASGATGWPCR